MRPCPTCGGRCPTCLGRGVIPDEKVCANETCGKTFTIQVGTLGAHRYSGVIYCSRACAKAQVQREYRRRKAAAS